MAKFSWIEKILTYDLYYSIITIILPMSKEKMQVISDFLLYGLPNTSLQCSPLKMSLPGLQNVTPHRDDDITILYIIIVVYTRTSDFTTTTTGRDNNKIIILRSRWRILDTYILASKKPYTQVMEPVLCVCVRVCVRAYSFLNNMCVRVYYITIIIYV